MNVFQKMLAHELLTESLDKKKEKEYSGFIANILSNPLGDTIYPYDKELEHHLMSFNFLKIKKMRNTRKQPMLCVSVEVELLLNSPRYVKMKDDRIEFLKKGVNLIVVEQKKALSVGDYSNFQILIDKEKDYSEEYIYLVKEAV